MNELCFLNEFGGGEALKKERFPLRFEESESIQLIQNVYDPRR